MAHTISNLDLDMRIALGNVLYAANDFRHSRSVGNGLAWGLVGAPVAQELLAAAKLP